MNAARPYDTSWEEIPGEKAKYSFEYLLFLNSKYNYV